MGEHLTNIEDQIKFHEDAITELEAEKISLGLEGESVPETDDLIEWHQGKRFWLIAEAAKS